jgi:WD40 repeat protein
LLDFLQAFARQNEICIVKNNGDTKRVAITKCKIHQVKYIEMHKTHCLAVLSNLGIQLWSMEGEHMIFHYALSSSLGTELEESRFMSGVASHAKYLFGGCSTGNILVFDAGSSLKSGFPLLRCIDSDRAPVLAMASSSNYFAAGNDEGNIFIYTTNNLELSTRMQGTGFPCTSLVATESILVAGFACGRIRLYRTTEGLYELFSEITAHARSVIGLALDPVRELVASVSPDSYLHVWSIPNLRSKATSNVGCVYSEEVDSAVMTGVAFLDENRLGVVSYDEDNMLIFSRV